MEKKLLMIRAYKLKELAALYLVSTRTMKKWINMHGDYIGKAFGHFYLYH